jgi:hypothetical protein
MSESDHPDLGPELENEPARSLALLIHDALRCTPEPTPEQLAGMADALSDYVGADGEWSEAQGTLFSRLYELGFELTPAFDPERWRELLTSGDTPEARRWQRLFKSDTPEGRRWRELFELGADTPSGRRWRELF